MDGLFIPYRPNERKPSIRKNVLRQSAELCEGDSSLAILRHRPCFSPRQRTRAVVDLLGPAGCQPKDDKVVRLRVHGHAVALRAFDLDVDPGPATPPVVAFV